MDDLTTLSIEDLRSLIEEKQTALAALFEVESPTDEQVAEAEALDNDLTALRTEETRRETAAAENAEKWSGLKQKFSEAPAEDDDAEKEAAEKAAAEAAEAEEAAKKEAEEAAAKADEEAKAEVAARGSSVETLASKTERPEPPAGATPSAISIVAAANVPDFNTGQKLDMDEVGSALVSRMNAFGTPSGDGKGFEPHRHPVAKFKMDFPEELTVNPHDEGMSVLHYAAKESRLEGGSLVAAGGWCAPSETLYDLCVTGESLDGIVSLPEVNIARGGINFTKGPDFSEIYANVGFLQTEAQAIAGTTKPCYEVPCPPFSEVRLKAIGLCIKAPILTNAAYPELVQRWLTGSMVAHAHKVNVEVIARMVALAGTAETVVDFSSTTQTTLSALELLANYKRQTYKLGLTETLEVVLPYWVKSAIRDDLSLRMGVGLDAVTDAVIAAHFAARHLNVQFVYDWQELDTSNATEGYSDSYTALIYPAGTFVKGVSDVIKLDAVYDAASLAVNTYTALFFEQGLLVANVCASASAVTLPVFNSGRTGIANLSVSGHAVA